MVRCLLRRHPIKRERFEPPEEESDLLDVLPASALTDRANINSIRRYVKGAANAIKGVQVPQIDSPHAVDAKRIPWAGCRRIRRQRHPLVIHILRPPEPLK